MRSLARTLILFFLLLGIAFSGYAQDEFENLITNPDFEEGINGWSLGSLADGAVGQLLIEEMADPDLRPVFGDCMVAQIDAVGADAWQPEIHSPRFDVEINEIYTVAFWAKADDGEARPIGIKFEQMDTWQGPSGTIDLTDEWTEYFLSPNMTVDSPPQVVIHIQFNGFKGNVYFDHFRVHQGEFIEEELLDLPILSVEPDDKLTSTWGALKTR